MKNGTLKKLLALVLAMTFILSLGLTAAFAEGGAQTEEAEMTCVEVKDTQDGVTVAAEVPDDQTVAVAVSEDHHTVTVDAGKGNESQASATAQGANVTVEVNNNVSGKGSEHDFDGMNTGVGVCVEGRFETAPQVTVDLNDHDVSAGSDETEGIITGIYASGNNVTVTGADEVTATGVLTATAVDVHGGADVKVETAVAETKDDTNDSTATAIQAASGGTVEANSATAKAVNGTAIGIAVKEGGGEVTADTVVAESENGDAIAISVSVSEDQGITPSVTINEDAESSNTGILVEGSGDAKAKVEVGETLKVAEGGTPVLLGSGVTKENIEITVWKVEIDGQQAKEGEIVKAKTEGGEEATDEQKAAAKAVEESIRYIIQIKPEQQSNIQSSKATAKANETFTVTVTPPDGKKLDAVYTDEGERIEAALNDDGTYSVTVRIGGGMYLSAKFSDKPVDPKPEPAPVPVPVPPSVDTGIAVANDWAAATVRLVPENGAYTLTLTTRVPTMTFLRQTLEKFAKYNDKFFISTPYGGCEISLAELLNFNVKAVNFRIVITSTALEIYVNGELFRSIFVSDLI